MSDTISNDSVDDNDFEDLVDTESPDDITSVIANSGIGRSIKIAAFIFLLFVFVCSDVFIDRLLSTKDNTFAEGRHPTSNGTAVQGVIVALGYIVINLLVTGGLI
jgi:hypothetical protein